MAGRLVGSTAVVWTRTEQVGLGMTWVFDRYVQDPKLIYPCWFWADPAPVPSSQWRQASGVSEYREPKRLIR